MDHKRGEQEERKRSMRKNPEPKGVTHAWAYINNIRLHYVHAGSSSAPPVVLLHGFPESWLMWRLILPELAVRFRTIALDLRGYGDSAKPAGVEGYDKGTMAADVHALLAQLGVGHILLIGHDRGARVARRYALDYSSDVAGAAMLDILPEEWVYDTLPAGEMAQRYWHWIFHLVPDLPERLITGREEAYLSRFFARSPRLLARLRAEGAWNEYLRTFLQRGAIAAALNDYRATFAVDVPRYRAERVVGRRVTAPTLLLWGERGNLAERPVLDIWGPVADNVRGAMIARCGHYLPEERPAEVAAHLLEFAASCFARV
jgi:pimeloyl-ACP methyl ester carboxylesterase